MKSHLEPESLSAYLDGELEGRERLEVEQHLSSCSDCSATRTRIAAAMGSVASLGPVTLTPDEHRVLRQTVLKSRPAPSARMRLGFPQWALAGGLALVAVTALALSFLRTGGVGGSDDGATEAAAPASGGASFRFASGEDVDRTVAALPEVAAGLNRYRPGEAGGKRAADNSMRAADPYSGSTTSDSAEQPGPMAAPALPPPESGNSAGSGAAGATAQNESAAAEGSGAYAFTNQAADECLARVAGTQDYPMVPLLAREATFRDRPAWLLVFAWSPDAGPDEPLDRWQSWLVDPVDCRDLSGPELAGKALYRSYSKAP